MMHGQKNIKQYVSIADIASYSYFIEIHPFIPLKCWQSCS